MFRRHKNNVHWLAHFKIFQKKGDAVIWGLCTLIQMNTITNTYLKEATICL